MTVFADLALARRLERTEAHANAMFVEGRAMLEPELGAAWTSIAGAYAMFDGADSPITQTFGVGLFDSVGAAELQAIEDFFSVRGAPVFHEISPLADPALLPLLAERGYRPIELSSVMVRALDDVAPQAPAANVRLVQASDRDLWVETAVEGWSEFEQYASVIRGLMRVSAYRPGALCFLAERDGRASAAGGMSVHEGVALMAGASTIPSARKQGAQLALLEARLRYAREQGCDLAMMCAAPGSASQRNAQRHGFAIAYTRIKWGRG